MVGLDEREARGCRLSIAHHILGPNGTVTGGGSGRKPNFNRVICSLSNWLRGGRERATDGRLAYVRATNVDLCRRKLNPNPSLVDVRELRSWRCAVLRDRSCFCVIAICIWRCREGPATSHGAVGRDDLRFRGDAAEVELFFSPRPCQMDFSVGRLQGPGTCATP